ncbi:MAG: phenylacetate--CoA ligase family protein [Deltaproteobacteria bacterium]|jgi:phenylacetate-coenzyme A ligase PaaK-like adenylate-forming protein|nr:phenylacetate--CoA ligase family protein [Deltaproteobacteria bacterium]
MSGAAPPNPLDARLDLGLPGPGPLPERLARERLSRLAGTLRLAADDSPFYRNLARKELLRAAAALEAAHDRLAGPAGAEEAILSALADLPVTEPRDLAASPESFLAVGQNEVDGVITVPSSGSRGPSKRIYSTEGDLKNTIDFFRYGMLNVLRPRKGARVALAMSGDRPGSVGDLLARALAFHGVGCAALGFLPPGRPELAAFRERLSALAPVTLVGLPSQTLYLARTGPKPRGLETVLLSGEPAPQSLVAAIQDAWGTEVFLHFGMTEFGLGGAVECRARAGPHLREADLLWETLPPGQTGRYPGRSLGPGPSGEITLTSLSRRAMPLIRYRTGDLGSLLPGPCACGSVFRRISTGGRIGDLLAPGLGLSHLAQAVYGLPGVAAFWASLSGGPEPLLTVRLGLPGRPVPGFPDLARAALAEALKGTMPFGIAIDPDPPPPATGGAKPALSREP